MSFLCPHSLVIALLILAFTCGDALAAGKFFTVNYPASSTGELKLEVTCTLRIPDDVKQVRAVIEAPLLEMRFTDATSTPGAKHVYRIISINGAGVRSAPSGGSSP